MTTSTECTTSKSACIDRCRCAHARFKSTLLYFRKKNIHIRIGNSGNKFIENTMCLYTFGSHFRKILLADSRPYNACRRIDLNSIESPTPNLEGTKRFRFVNMLNNVLLPGTKLQERGSHFERSRGRIGILKTSGIRNETRKKECGNVSRQTGTKSRSEERRGGEEGRYR